MFKGIKEVDKILSLLPKSGTLRDQVVPDWVASVLIKNHLGGTIVMVEKGP